MSLKKIIDLDLLGRFFDKVKELIPTKVSELENDARYMSGMTILSYGKSTWADFMEAYGDNKVIYCRASSNSNPASGSQTRMAFMAYVNNQTTPTEVEFQYYRSVNAHTDAQQGDQVYVYKLNKNNGWSVIVRNAFSKLVTGTGLTHTYSNGTITIENSEIVPGVVSTTADGLAPQLPDESTTTKFLRQDATWAAPEYPVTSVNGSTGAVTVDVPSKTSDLQNDSGFITGITSVDVTTALGYTPPRQDTTYESKAAVSGGTDVSLVTTGEKYTWNNKGTYSKPSGGIPDSDIASAAVWNAKGNGTITGIEMNGASKGSSGVVDLGTVITAHQDISGKADKSATVSDVAYDSTNKKITKTINGTTSDVVSVATIKTDLALAKGDVGLGNVDNVKQYSASNPPPYPVTSVNGNTGAVTVDVPTKTSDITNDSGFITSSTGGLPAGGSANQFLMKSSGTDYDTGWITLYSGEIPLMDSGSGDPGLSSMLSRRDHRHPTDTSRQAKITASGILKGDGSGGVSAAVAGTDYLTPATNYSPVRFILATPYNISAADIGATVCCGYNMRNTPITVNLTQEVSATLPAGAEIAVLNFYASDITIAVSGIQVGVSGIDGGGPTKFFYSNAPHSFKPGDIYSMLALKKIVSDSTYGDNWLLTGNVEVIS